MDDPDRWQEGFLETGRIESLAQHPLRETLQKVWDAVSRRLGSGRKRQEREAKRKANRQAAERALVKLWPKLGPVARERLASHHALMIVCSDLEEVKSWEGFFDLHFPIIEKKPPRRAGSLTAFVRWLHSPSGPTVAALVIDGPPVTVDQTYLVAHEMAHIVVHREGRPLHEDPKWKGAFETEKLRLRRFFLDKVITEDVANSVKESLAWALAVAWLNPAGMRHLPKMEAFFRRQGLTREPRQGLL